MQRNREKNGLFHNLESASPHDGGTTVNFELSLFGRSMRLDVPASDEPMRLADIVPLAWSICDQLVNRTIEHIQADGETPSCHRGCGACCRYAVPLSVPEAFRLREDISAMPARQRAKTEKLFAKAVTRIVQAGRPEIPTNSSDQGDSSPVKALAQWYASMDMPCPLLMNECCDFYSFRPTACREHLVTSSPACCIGNNPDTGSRVAMPFSVTTALAMLAEEMEGLPFQAIIMTTALQWCDDNAARAQRTWPGRELIQRFADILQKLADQGERKSQTAATNAA